MVGPVSLNLKEEQSLSLKKAFLAAFPDLWKFVIFSFVINVLILSPTWYMLEVYDRVLNSNNHFTLLMLTIMIVGLYILLEILEWVRSRIAQQASSSLDVYLRDKVFESIFQAKLKQQPSAGSQGFSDLKTVQDFLVSPAFTAIIDTPIALITLVIVFLIDPYLGWLSIVGAIVIGLVAVFNYKQVEPVMSEASGHFISAQTYTNSLIRNAQAIESMGMLAYIHKRWLSKQQSYLYAQALASDRAGLSASISKTVQLLQGSLILGLGSWLVIVGMLDAASSIIIVTSMLAARALAPLVIVVGRWRMISSTHDAVERLDEMLKQYVERKPNMSLPPPAGNLSIDNVTAAPPGATAPILKNIGFKLPAGNSLAVVGPSASGKTTLARILTGIWPASSGSVRLDGVDVYHWDKKELGPYVGYLPQGVELFDGTIAENIARFAEVDMHKVETAAQAVGLERFILSLDQGYQTHIGDEGAFLSGGQRQRIALARAIYGMPKLLVLDEPNSSLDEEGDAALMNALQLMKSQGSTVIVITHRPQILTQMDYMMLLVDGQIKAFDTPAEVLNAINAKISAKSKAKAVSGVAK